MSCLKFFIIYVFFWFENVVHPKQSHVVFIIKNKMDSFMTIRWTQILTQFLISDSILVENFEYSNVILFYNLDFC